MKIKDLFEKKEKTFSFEIFPPKTPEGDIKLIHETLKELSLLSPDFVSCTYGAAGGNKDKTLALVEHIQKAYDIPSMAHLTCISHTKDEIHEIVKKIKTKGIQNILALRGDPPRDNPNLVPGIDNYKHSSELITFLRQEYKDYFCLGVAGFPEMHPLSATKENDMKYLKYKIDCGADFVITQLFFDNQIYFDYVESVRKAGITTRIIPGILPITSYDGLIKFCNTCGATIPEKVHEIFAPIKDNPKKVMQAGIDFAINQCIDLLSNGAPGIHFYTLNKIHPIKEIITAIKGKFLMNDEKLPDINCPKCNKQMSYDDTKKIGKTGCFEDCVRVCTNCGCGVSNSKSKPTYIYKNYIDNLPERYKEDKKILDILFNHTLNETNRENKKMKFGFSTSEDACSWIFFTYFFKKNKLNVLKDILGLESEIKDILFWGVSYNDLINSKISEISDGILESNNIIKNLKQSADDIGEVPKLKTEPDIIVVTDEELVFIEVKVKSGMPVKYFDEKKDDRKKFLKRLKNYEDNKYYENFDNLGEKYYSKKNPFYELVRNWTLLNDLGEKLNKKVSLINLVREEETKEIKIFKDAIKQKPKKRNFKIKTWKEIFKELEEEHKINVYDGSFKNLEDNKCF